MAKKFVLMVKGLQFREDRESCQGLERIRTETELLPGLAALPRAVVLVFFSAQHRTRSRWTGTAAFALRI